MKLQPKNLQNIDLSKFGKKITKKMPPMAGKIVPPDVFQPGRIKLPTTAGLAPMPKTLPKKLALGAIIASAFVAGATAIVNAVKNAQANKVEKEADVKPQEVNVPEVETTEVEAPEVTDIQE